MFEEAKKIRDRRLRRKILETLDAAKNSPNGRLSAVVLVDVINGALSEAEGFEDEDHALRLIRDVVNKGYVAETPRPRRRTERFGLRHFELSITARGTSLVLETAPVDADIDDERIS